MNAPIRVASPSTFVPPKRLAIGSGLVASAGAVTSFGAVCASSICAIPWVLAGIAGGSSFMAGLEWLTAYRTPLLVANGTMLAVGWFLYFRRLRMTNDCEHKNRAWFTLAMLGVATSLFGLAFLWDAFLEYPLMGIVS